MLQLLHRPSLLHQAPPVSNKLSSSKFKERKVCAVKCSIKLNFKSIKLLVSKQSEQVAILHMLIKVHLYNSNNNHNSSNLFKQDLLSKQELSDKQIKVIKEDLLLTKIVELIKVKYSLFQVSIKITQRLKLITTIYKFNSHNNRITCNRVIRREQHLLVDAKPDQAHTMTIINQIQNHHTHRKITGHKIRRI